MIQQISQRSVLHNPLLCRLLSHSGNARQVIRGITPQRGEIRILLRRQPVLLLHRIRGKPVQRAHTAHRVKHRGCTIHQLKRVAVTRDNQGFKPKGLGGCRKRGDNIVGLVVLLLQGGNSQRLKHLLNQINLPLKLLGRGVALSLILGKHLRTERVAPNVKRHGHVRRLLLLDEVSEHRQKPIHRVRVLATRRGEVLCRQGIKRAKSHRMPVDEHQTTRGIWGAGGSCYWRCCWRCRGSHAPNTIQKPRHDHDGVLVSCYGFAALGGQGRRADASADFPFCG